MINDEFEFAIVMAIYNTEDYLEEAIETVINQTIRFKDNVQLILVDDGSTDKSKEICLKYKDKYRENIVYLYQENQGQATARNNGLNYVKAKYVNFLDSDDKLSLNALEEVSKFFDKHFNEVDLVSIPYKLFEAQEGEHVLNYKFYETRVIDIFKEYDCIQLSSSTCFIKKSVLEENPFPKLITSEDSMLVNKIILNKCKYGVVNSCHYNYRKRLNHSSTLNQSILNEKYYLERMEHYFNELIDYSKNKFNDIPQYIQFLIMYDLQWMFKINKVDDILSDNKIETLNKKIIDILQVIEDDIIYSQNHITDALKNHILCLKHGYSEVKEISKRRNVELSVNNHTLDYLNIHSLNIDFINVNEKSLIINGFFSSMFDNDEIKIEGIRNKEVYRAKKLCYPQRDYISLNKVYNTKYNFSIEIPLLKNEINYITFVVKYKTGAFNPKLSFFNDAKLSTYDTYFKLKNKIVLIRNNKLLVKKYSFSNLIKAEVFSAKNIIKSRKKCYLKAMKLRFLYFLTYPYYKNKRIWVFMDRIDRADDNAEHFFRYCLKQNDKIKKYFIIDKDKEDYNRLKKIGKTIHYNSPKHLLLMFHAEKFISSHADDNKLKPFGKCNKFLSGKRTFEFIFLQHGIIKDNLSNWIPKYKRNINLFVTSTKKEYESILNEDYGFNEKELKLTGLPRYDNLKNNPVNEIYIMPSWRRSAFKDESAIKNSVYIKGINDLINDSKLIEYLKSKNYKIIFKPHPNVIPYIDCFDKSKYVEFLKYEIRYQEIFERAKLIITDYSSIAFDFAYLKKPLIYYQYDEEYHLEKGYFDYETMGFGEVIKNHDEVVDKIIEYIDNDCEMSDKYKERVDEFFEFNDRNNCKRVYDEIMKI